MIFVTGGTGFLGSYLIKSLIDNGEQVRAIRRKESSMEMLQDYANKVQWVEGDLLDVNLITEVLEGCSQVYHCGAVVAFNKQQRNDMYKVNVDGTANVVNACLQYENIKLVHVSSIAALGRDSTGKVMDENTKWENNKLNTHYAITKFLAEREVWRGIEEGLDAVMVNPAVILGAAPWKTGTAKFFALLNRGFKLYPLGQNGFVDVRDVVKSMILLMNSDISAERYVLSSENWTYFQLFQRISECLDVKAPSIKTSKWLSEIVWRIEHLRSLLTGSNPLLTRETAKVSSTIFAYSSRKIQDELNFEFRSVNNSIEDIAEVFKSKATYF